MKLKERFHHIFEDKFTAILIFVILAFVVMLLLNVGNRFFHRDELEHIHSSWYVASNYLPYVDFFQSHHPLLWFILAPFILVFGDSTAILFVGRAFMLLCFLGTVGLVYRMGILITEKKQIALISATLLLSSLAFSQKGIETRPETPQAFFAVLFVYYLISFLKQGGTTLSAASLDQGQPGQAVNVRYNKIFLAGLAASIAFLFLQKFIFLLAIVLIIFIYMLYKRNITFKAIVFFLLGFIGPLSLLIVYLLVTGSFSDYILNCWQVPARILYSFSPHHTIIGLAIENFIFWVLVITAAISLFSPKKKTVNRELRLLTFLGILLVPIFTLVLSLPNKENFLLPIALCALPAGYAFGEVCKKFDLRLKGKSGLLLAAVLLPFVILVQLMTLSNTSQLDKYHFVLNQTTAEDVVYDGGRDFNLFRKDVHYFWYGLEPNMEFATYNKITGNKKYGDYDIFEIIQKEKPKFISDSRLKITSRGLHRFYKETKYKGLYIRR